MIQYVWNVLNFKINMCEFSLNANEQLRGERNVRIESLTNANANYM